MSGLWSEAFSWFSASSYAGFMGGAGLGGYLSSPVGRVPILGQLVLFERYPFVLPGLVVGSLCGLAGLAVFLLVPEVSPPILLHH